MAESLNWLDTTGVSLRKLRAALVLRMNGHADTYASRIRDLERHYSFSRTNPREGISWNRMGDDRGTERELPKTSPRNAEPQGAEFWRPLALRLSRARPRALTERTTAAIWKACG